jgi:N-acetylmuramoyl-L-alanine amidase
VRRAALVAVALLLAACAAEEEAAPPASPSTTGTTTAVATTTTTTAPLPALPGAVPTPDPRGLVTPTGVVVPVVGTAAEGLRVRTPCGSSAVVAGGTPLFGATVVLDPGHGGDEPGALGANGLREADLNLAVAQRAADRLRAAGATVVLTRTTDVRVTLTTRALLATRLGAGALVSVHHNADPDGPSDRPGTEAWYRVDDPPSRRLAGLVQEEVAGTFAAYDGVAWQADRDAGAKSRRRAGGDDYYGVLRDAGVPAAISEGLFLSNPPEAALLARPDVQQAEADALARAVARFLTTDDAGSGFVDAYPRREAAGPGGGSAGCVDPPLTLPR